jgi:hypothetical protein
MKIGDRVMVLGEHSGLGMITAIDGELYTVTKDTGCVMTGLTVDKLELV